MKKNIEILAAKNTPKIVGSTDSKSLLIEGNSFPENARKFYAQVNDFVIDYCSINDSIEITCEFNYLASSSLITVLNIIKNFEKILDPQNCILNWKFEDDDDDILKIGEDFQKVLDMEVKFCPIKD